MQPRSSPFPPVTTPDEAQALFGELQETLNQLSAVLAKETELTKAGKLHEALPLQAEKIRLTGFYVKAVERYRASAAYCKRIQPELSARLQDMHQRFRSIVSVNMATLATASALSESLIHEIVETVNEYQRPAGYTAKGVTPTAVSNKTQPLKVNRAV